QQRTRHHLLGNSGRKRLAPGQILSYAGRQRRVASQSEIQCVLARQGGGNTGKDKIAEHIIATRMAVTIPVVVEIVVIAASIIITTIDISIAQRTFTSASGSTVITAAVHIRPALATIARAGVSLARVSLARVSLAGVA